jgi:hypothetical protein
MRKSAQEVGHSSTLDGVDPALGTLSQHDRRVRRLRRLGYGAGLATVAVLTVAACSSSSSSPGTTSTAPAPASSSPSPNFSTTPSFPLPSPSKSPSSLAPQPTMAMCTSSGLKVEIGSANGAAGSTYVTLDYKNVGSAACWLYGYPGVSSWNGGQIGEAAVRDTAVKPSVVDLGPGAIATSIVRITDEGVYSPTQCDPEQAVDLKVFPPGSFGFQLVPDEFTACAGSVPLLHVEALTTG